uniref:Putative secreted protein n=1 Tax=Anopheles triannulatus TaxID=58253 RepID=A0A2M4B5H8_9DIPT
MPTPPPPYPPPGTLRSLLPLLFVHSMPGTAGVPVPVPVPIPPPPPLPTVPPPMLPFRMLPRPDFLKLPPLRRSEFRPRWWPPPSGLFGSRSSVSCATVSVSV